MTTRPVISVGQARKLLGKDARLFSDNEVMVIITTLSDIAVTQLNKAVSFDATEVIESIDGAKNDG